MTPENFIKRFRDLDDTAYSLPDDRTAEYVASLDTNLEAQAYLMGRGLSSEVIEKFRVGVSGNYLVFPVIKNGKVIDYKHRSYTGEKKYFRVKNTESYIFNEEGLSEAAKVKSIFIVEGEIDTMTLWDNGYKNVISSSSGVQFVGSWINKLDDLDKIYLCLDNDDAGNEATKKLARRLGEERCINIILPVKDSNDFFKDNTKEDFDKIVSVAKPISLTGVFRLSEYVDQARQEDELHFKFGYDNIDRVVKGFNRGEVIMMTAYTSMYKTTFTSNILMKQAELGVPTLFMPLEGDIRYVAKRLLSMSQGSPPSAWNDNDWEAVKKNVAELPLYLYVGGEEDMNLELLKNIVASAKKIYGIEILVLDHIHYFAERSAKSQSESIGHLIREINRLAKLHDVTIFVIAHVTKPTRHPGQNNHMHRPPSMADMRDSSFLMQDPDKVIVLHQNGFDVDRGTLQLRMEKNRYGPKILEPVAFNIDHDTGRITESNFRHSPEELEGNGSRIKAPNSGGGKESRFKKTGERSKEDRVV